MFKFLKRPVHLSLLRNAINAKLTLVRSDPDRKMQVYAVANAVYVSNGRITDLDAALEKVRQNMPQLDTAFSRMSEFEKCTLYSLAMMELGIEPALVGEGWQVPPGNPFSSISDVDETDLSNGIAYFYDKHRLQVTLALRSE
jgi:hypothetical protein